MEQTSSPSDAQLSCIVACVGEPGRYPAVLRTATERAKGHGAKVILYNVATAGSFTSVRPNEWAGEGAGEMFDHPLDPVELERLGQHDFALEVQRLRNDGIDAFGWLPEGTGGSALSEYAAQQGADLVLVPSDIDDRTFIEDLNDAASGSDAATPASASVTFVEADAQA